MLIEEFSGNHIENKDIIFDLHYGSSIGLSGLKNAVTRAISYFEVEVGLKSADKVALFLENSLDYVIIFLALLETEAIIVPLNPKLNKEKLEFYLRHSEARLLITSEECLKKNAWLRDLEIRALLAEDVIKASAALSAGAVLRGPDLLSKDSAKFIFYTSGTTGNPKGVVLSGRAVKNKIISLVGLLRLSPSEAFFSFLPFYSGHGLIPGMLVPLLSGCRMYIERFDPFLVPRFWESVKTHGIGYFTSVPSILTLLKEQGRGLKKEDVPALKYIFSASAALPEGTCAWFRESLGLRVRNCYGLTEAASWISVSPLTGKDQPANCVGKAFDSEIAVFNEEGRRLASNDIGEFWVKGPSNMSGYYKNERETELCTCAGFIKTGDRGYIDKEGNIFISDRIKNIIKRSGINITPAEIDQVFLGHEDVIDCASFGVPDKDYGERLVTALVLQNGLRSQEKYIKYAIDRLPVFLVPNEIIFLDSIPKGPTGKVLVGKLRDDYLNYP